MERSEVQAEKTGKENTGNENSGKAGTGKESAQYIVIRLGKERYGIDILCIDNIVRMQQITRVPRVPAYLKGVINLRGEVLPVMSIRLKMGLTEEAYTRNTRIVILKLPEYGSIGIIVDEVTEVVRLWPEEIEKLPCGGNEEKLHYVNAVGKHDGELISLLDIRAVI